MSCEENVPPAAGVPIIGLLGPVSIADENGRMRPVPGIRARRLLAVLALTPGSQRSQSALIDGVWGDDLPRSPQSALHTQISRLRPLLPEGAIEAGPAGYRLTLPAVAVDVFTAQSLLADGSAQSLEAAARLWRGAPGDDLGDDDLARDVRQAADRVQVELDERRSQKALDDGDFETARALAQRRADADPLDESAHATLMRALSALGRVPRRWRCSRVCAGHCPPNSAPTRGRSSRPFTNSCCSRRRSSGHVRSAARCRSGCPPSRMNSWVAKPTSAASVRCSARREW